MSEETFLGNVTENTEKAGKATNAAENTSVNADVAKEDTAVVTPDGAGKETSVADLTDEQFEKIIERMAKDDKLPYHKNPAWQRIISQRNQSTQKADALFTRYAQKDPQGALEQLLDEGMDEGEARFKLQSMGVDLNAQKATEAKASPKAEVDDAEFIKLLNSMNVKYEQLSPEQIQFWKFQYQFNKQMFQPMVDPLNKFVDQTKTEKQREEAEKVRSSYDAEVKELTKQVKDKYGLDWDKEVEPELLEYLKANPNFQGTPKQLFREVFFDKVEELGKRAKSVEDAKLNAEKKSIKSEDGGSSGGETKPAGVGKNWNATWEYLKNKHGYKD